MSSVEQLALWVHAVRSSGWIGLAALAVALAILTVASRYVGTPAPRCPHCGSARSSMIGERAKGQARHFCRACLRTWTSGH